MTNDQKNVVRALWTDLRKSYPDLTLEIVETQAVSQLAGEKAKGIIGMFVHDTFVKAGWIRQ